MNENIPSDAITSLLLFLLGVPALVYQMVPEGIRRLVTTKASISTRFILGPLLGIVVVLGTYLAGETVWRTQDPSLWEITLGILVLLCILTSAMILPTIIDREHLITDFAYELAKDYREGGEYTDDGLAKLELIGKESMSGEEKEWSIKALAKLANHVLGSSSYSGGQLEGLTRTLDHILLESGKPSTPANYRSAIAILGKVIARSYEGLIDNPEFYDADLGHAWRYLGIWARKSLDLFEQGITAECLDLLDPLDDKPNPALSEALREIGIAAVKHEPDQVQIALEAARKIQIILLEGDAHLYPEVTYDLMGLLSYIWWHGESGQAWIRREFNIASDEMFEAVKSSVEHHRRTGHFEIADRVKTMSVAWQQV